MNEELFRAILGCFAGAGFVVLISTAIKLVEHFGPVSPTARDLENQLSSLDSQIFSLQECMAEVVCKVGGQEKRLLNLEKELSEFLVDSGQRKEVRS